MPLTLLTEAVVNGVLLGLVYALISVGLSLTLGVLGVVNMAHSAFVMLGSFFALELLLRLGAPPMLSVLAAAPLFFGVGMAVDRLLLRRTASTSEAMGLLVLFGLMLVLENGAILVWTTDTRVLPWQMGQMVLAMGGLRVSFGRLLAAGLALTMILVLDFLLRRTLLGKVVRAVGQNPDAAAVLGVDVTRISMVVVGAGVATAAMGGVAVAMMFPFAPQEHLRWLAWAFLLVIVGGLGRVRNTLVAGLLVGQLEALSGILLPFQYVYAVVYAFLAITLILRGRGLQAAQERTL
ncbi:MAG: branched-chain amino acid ABC transporter permease [Armatimonadota bacterium]|nr:branched-chain amino acid ABC transporter permease [Armatimonadota bacterium]MDR7561950.1 branched-chain amino acid ABC transporter permease [Armatimonadota bacterium]MDR7601861.1 branched-chain amino acid ABC transporter permease [Armatimonadota bacterium]